MAKRTNITPELLLKLLRHDPNTGKLYWLKRTPDLFEDGLHSAKHKCNQWNSRYAGKEAFTTSDGNGCKQGAIFGRTYKAHRVIEALLNGAWPEKGYYSR